ncbi:MAG: porin family protein [Alistipes sp.]|nr:porin family protein [Alistipes senegalensis]MCM1249984.1 porin family protein [Alistipes sp.]
MKKLCTLGMLAAMLLATTAAIAQEKKEKNADPEYKGWWIGGEVGLWHSTDAEDWGTVSVALSPEIGYDFNKRWGLGVAIGYAYASTETAEPGYDGYIKANVFLFNPYARWKYYNPGRVSLFLDGGIGVAGGDMDGFKIGIQPGVAVRINKHVRFQAHLGFLGYCTNYFNDGTDDSQGFGFRFSSSDLKLGFCYTF